MNKFLTIKCTCGNTTAEYTSFDNNNELLAADKTGAKCTNCNTVHIKTNRTAKTLYRALAFDVSIDLDITFKRLTLKKAKELLGNKDFWHIVECNTNKAYYVHINEYTNKAELTEFNPYEI